MSFFLDEDKAVDISSDEYATGNKTSYGENLAASWDLVKKTSLSISEDYNLRNTYQETIDEAAKLGHTDLFNPYVQQPYFGYGDDTEFETTEEKVLNFHQRLDKKMQEDPQLNEVLASKNLHTQDAIQTKIGIDARASQERFADINARAGTSGKIGGFVGNMGIALDPIFLATVPVGFAYQLPKTFLAAAWRVAWVEGLLAGIAETTIQYGAGVDDYRRDNLKLGEQDLKVAGITLSPAQQKILFTSAGTAVFGPALLGVFKGIGKSFDLTGKGFAKLKNKLDELPIHRLKRIYKEFTTRNPQYKREDLDSFVNSNVIDDDVPQFVDEPTTNTIHNERINEAYSYVFDDEPPKTLNEPANVKINYNELNNYNSTVKTLDPDEIEFRPQEFQYKQDGDERGVSKKLAGVETWDAPSAGTIITYKYRDGKIAIVDGHQRLGLAKRLKAAGQKDIKLIAHQFNEADGVLPEEMLLVGLLANLRNNTGSAFDAAKAMRVANLDWDKIKLSLPVRQKLIENAQGLKNLSDDAWGFFKSKNIDEDLAARVGSKIENKEAHLSILATLSKQKFRTLQEIDTVLEQIKNTPVYKAQQETLFGKEFFAKTLILEKSKLINNLVKNTKQLQQVFRTVLENEKDLTLAGNVLDRQANQQQGLINEKIFDRLIKVATTPGKLSDELNQAAVLLQQGKQKEANELAKSAVQRAIERGDFERLTIGGLQRADDIAPERPAIRKETPRAETAEEDLKNLIPTKKVIDDQVDELNTNLFGEDLPETAPRTVQTPEETGLVNEIKLTVATEEAATKYLNHPLLKAKIENGKKFLLDTSKRPGFTKDKTAQFWQTRDFGSFGTGLNAFINKFYGGGARVKNKQIVIIMGPSASGKSSFIREFNKDFGGYVADSDDIKKVLPEFEKGINSDGVHAESSAINHFILEKAGVNGDNIIYPTTGRDAKKLNIVISEFEKAGYDVKVQNIKIDRNEAILRNIVRTFETNRIVDSQKLLSKKVVNDIQNNYNKLNEKYKIGEIDNSTRTASGKAPESFQRSRPSGYRDIADDEFTATDLDTKIPDETIIDPATGEKINTSITMRDAIEREKLDDQFINRMKDCT